MALQSYYFVDNSFFFRRFYLKSGSQNNKPRVTLVQNNWQKCSFVCV